MSSTVHGRVTGGRLQVDQPVDLPEGAQVELVIVDAEDGLDDTDRARLHDALDDADAELARGEGIPVAHVIAEARYRSASPGRCRSSWPSPPRCST